jgi:hypothetical protein
LLVFFAHDFVRFFKMVWGCFSKTTLTNINK